MQLTRRDSTHPRMDEYSEYHTAASSIQQRKLIRGNVWDVWQHFAYVHKRSELRGSETILFFYLFGLFFCRRKSVLVCFASAMFERCLAHSV